MKDENRKSEPITFADIAAKMIAKKPTAHTWQGLALKIIQELKVPPIKKSSVFRVCKTNSTSYIERCLADTKELCEGANKWAYFFKVVNNAKKEQAGDEQALKQKQMNFDNYVKRNAPKKIIYN